MLSNHIQWPIFKAYTGIYSRYKSVQWFHTIMLCCSGCWLCLPFTVTCSPNIQRGKQFRLPAQTQCSSISFPVSASWDNAQMILACALKWILVLWMAEQTPLRTDIVHKQGEGCRNWISCAINGRFLVCCVHLIFKASTTGITLNKILELDKYCQMHSVKFISKSYE